MGLSIIVVPPFAGIGSPVLYAPTSTFVKSAGMSTWLMVPGVKIGPVPPAPVALPAVPVMNTEPLPAVCMPTPLLPPLPVLLTPSGWDGLNVHATNPRALAITVTTTKKGRRAEAKGAGMRSSYE